MKNLDLRKTRASTVVDDMGDEFTFDQEKESIIDKFLANVEISPGKIIYFLIKVSFCAAGVLVLKHLEKDNLRKLNIAKDQVGQELVQLQKKQKTMEEQVNSFGYMRERSKEFDNKISIMQKIVDDRLVVIQGLDSIQSVIPEEVWLKKVTFRNQKFTLEGLGTTNHQINRFIEKLEKTNLFSSVNLEKSKKDMNSKTFNRRDFTIVSVLK